MEIKPEIWIREIKTLIARGNTEGAIQLFFQQTEEDDKYKFIKNRLVLLSSRYQEFRSGFMRGTVSTDDNTHAVTNERLLGLLEDVEKGLSGKTGEYKNYYQEILSRILLATSSADLEQVIFELNRAMRKNEDDYEIYKLLKVAESASNWMRNARKSTTDVFKVTLADLLTDLRKDLYDDFHGYL